MPKSAKKIVPSCAFLTKVVLLDETRRKTANGITHTNYIKFIQINYKSMSKIIKLKKGLDINLQGKAAESLVELPLAAEYAVSPLDFENVTPKLLVKVGDKVTKEQTGLY